MRSRLRPLRAAARSMHGGLLQLVTDARWRAGDLQRPHALPAPLIVSLTSYPPRFAALAASLKCLLTQSVRPDLVVLWVAHQDAASLPSDVLALRRAGLRIERCAELGPHKKLVPARTLWPHAFIATADDDVYYARDWLAELIAAWVPGRREIPCHRAHRVKLTSAGLPASYAHWRFEAPPGPASPLTFPTGVGGVLYPPKSLHPDAGNTTLLEALAPTSDDAWVYWMARRQGWMFRRISRRRFVCWPGTQHVALQNANAPVNNDLQIARLASRFGFPGGVERARRAAPARA